MTSAGQSFGEEIPGKDTGKCKERVRNSLGGKAGKLIEDKREHHHRRDGADDRPSCAKKRLLIPDLDIPPDKKIEQLAVFPQLRQMDCREGLRSLYDEWFDHV